MIDGCKGIPTPTMKSAFLNQFHPVRSSLKNNYDSFTSLAKCNVARGFRKGYMPGWRQEQKVCVQTKQDQDESSDI